MFPPMYLGRDGMRFWITKNSEIPLREQLVRQVIMGILSEDLPAGQKLPSVRAIARRHRIHSNTVSAAFHDLLEQGWLELHRGSGLYVRSRQESDGDGRLDQMLASLLKAAKVEGYEPEAVLARIERMVRPRTYERIVIAEPDPAMGEIVLAEIGEQLQVPTEPFANGGSLKDALVVALPTRVARVKAMLPKDAFCLTLRVRSVGGSLEGHAKPAAEIVVTIVSRSAEIRYGARAMLIAAGLDPLSLSEIDASGNEWNERIGSNALVVTDVVAARELPEGCNANVYRVIADSSIEEIRRLCGCERVAVSKLN